MTMPSTTNDYAYPAVRRIHPAGTSDASGCENVRPGAAEWTASVKRRLSKFVRELQHCTTFADTDTITTVFESIHDSTQRLRLFACECPRGSPDITCQPKIISAVADCLTNDYAVLFLFSTEVSNEVKLELYREGVAEVMTSTLIDPDKISTQISSALARHRFHSKLRFSADNDPLTRVLNRRAFDIRLRQAADSGTSLALFYIDLDYFKETNDHFGHVVGDKALVEASRRLKSHLRASDVLARLGGDEFAALLIGVNRSQAMRIAERMVKTVREVMKFDKYQLVQTCSIGVAMGLTKSTRGTHNLTACADKALYNAKLAGRDRASCYKVVKRRVTNYPPSSATTQDNWKLSTDLRQALDADDQLSLAYQPQVDIYTGGIHGMEALIRWNHPERGYIPPDEFIPRAEQCGLIQPLGDLVRQMACEQFVGWRSRCDLTKDFKLCINVSALEFFQERCITGIVRDLGSFGNSIELELTETAIGRNSKTLSHRMEKIREAGIQLALDDFGTGSSSLSHITELPVNTIKVDKSFVQAAALNPRAAAVVESVYTLADRLDVRVVAEGIETPEHCAFLRKMGASDGQGYLFSRGVDGSAAEQLLARKYIGTV